MSSVPSHFSWGAESLWSALRPLLPDLSVEVLARCESTNTELLERVRRAQGREDDRSDGRPFGRRAGDSQPCLLVAEHQTRGRGRMGRTWQSAPGASLTFSLAVPLAAPDLSGLSLAVGVALAEAIDPAPPDDGPRVALKWPNDLWLLDAQGRGRKLGGVLIETVPLGRRRMVVVGVGLNVHPQPMADDLPQGHASADELMAGIDAPALLHRVATPLAQALRQFEQEGFAPGFQARFATRDLLRGHAVTLTGGAPLAGGLCEGVDAHGALLVRAEDGTLHALASAEVSVRLEGSEPSAAVPLAPPSPPDSPAC